MSSGDVVKAAPAVTCAAVFVVPQTSPASVQVVDRGAAAPEMTVEPGAQPRLTGLVPPVSRALPCPVWAVERDWQGTAATARLPLGPPAAVACVKCSMVWELLET